MSSQKCLNKNIYRRFSYSRQKLGTTKMSTNRRMDKQIVVYLQDGRLLSNQRCCRTHAHCNSDRFQSTSVWGKEASHRNVYPAWFHIYKVLQQEKVVNSAVWHIGKLLREYILSVLLITRRKCFFLFFFLSFILYLYEMMDVSWTYCDNYFLIYVNQAIIAVLFILKQWCKLYPPKT